MKEWEKTEIEEGRPDGKISRRQFVKGMAWGAAAISLSSILPGCAAAAVATGTEGTTKGAGETTAPVSAGSPEGGIYIQGGDINMNGQTYTLEFIQPVKLVAKIDGEEKTEGTWRSSNKHLVSVDPDGTIVMRDGVGDMMLRLPGPLKGPSIPSTSIRARLQAHTLSKWTVR